MNKLKTKRGLNIDIHARNKIVNERLQVCSVEKPKTELISCMNKLSRENLKTFNNLYDSVK